MTPDRTWLDAAPDAMVVVDGRGEIVFANDRCQTLLGWEPGDLVGQSIEVLVPPRHHDHGQVRSEYLGAPVMRPMGVGRELEARHRDGHDLPVEIALSPVLRDGQRFGVAAVRDSRPQRALLQKLKLQSIALDASASGVVITNRDGVIEWVNPAVTHITGYTADELVGQRPSVLKSGKHEPGFYAELWATVSAGRDWHGSIVNRTKSGALYSEEQTISPVRGPDGQIAHFIAIKHDVTARVRAQEALAAARDELARRVAEVEALHAQLREEAIRDALTGLFNRRYLDETLPRELANALRKSGDVAVAMIDADYFKSVNDTHGHPTGDKLLMALAAILRSRSRVGDIACRFGGEEFVVLLVGAAQADALRCAEEWRRAFKAVTVEGPTGPVSATCSIGVASWVRGEDAGALLARADAALYEAKRSGRDRVIIAPRNGSTLPALETAKAG